MEWVQPLQADSKLVKLTEAECGVLVARDWEEGEWGGNGQRALPHCILLQKQGQETDLQLIMFSRRCILRFF